MTVFNEGFVHMSLAVHSKCFTIMWWGGLSSTTTSDNESIMAISAVSYRHTFANSVKILQC